MAPNEKEHFHSKDSSHKTVELTQGINKQGLLPCPQFSFWNNKKMAYKKTTEGLSFDTQTVYLVSLVTFLRSTASIECLTSWYEEIDL